jgi:hypothetical protein
MARGLSGERIEKILLHNICNEIFLSIVNNPPWYSGQCSCLARWRPGFNSPDRQIFKLTFSPTSPSPPVAITKLSSLDLQPLKSLKFSPLKELLREKECQL